MVPLIYCYDDEPAFRKSMSRLLRHLTPCRVVVFEDPAAVVATTIASPPDLLITDNFHPGLSGVDMVLAVRRSTTAKKVPIWIISGTAGLCEEAALAAGATLVLAKPIGSEDIMTRLRALFGSPHLAPVDIDAEAPDLDIKELPCLSSKDGAARLAKDVISMANFGGGHLVFGKRDDRKGGFEWVGLSASDLAELEVSRLNRAINAYLDPEMHVTPRVVTSRGVTLVEVRVPAATDLVMAAKQNDNAKLYPGRIYTRTANVESAEAQTAHEVRRIIDRLVRAKGTPG